MADVLHHSTLPTGLISYWELEETSGTRYDSHGSNDLVDGNTVGYTTSGKLGNAADFASTSSEYFETPSDIGSTNAFSISLWVNPDRVNVNESLFHKCDTTSSDTSGAEFRLLMLSAGTFQWSIGNGTLYKINRTISHGMSAGTWYHIVMTWDGTDATLYKNNSVLDSVTDAFTRHQSSEPLQIGRRERGAANDLYYDGQLDEIGFWDKELTSSEVSDLYASGSGLQYDDGGGAATSISSIVGVAQADISSMAGVAIADIASVAGVSNTS